MAWLPEKSASGNPVGEQFNPPKEKRVTNSHVGFPPKQARLLFVHITNHKWKCPREIEKNPSHNVCMVVMWYSLAKSLNFQ